MDLFLNVYTTLRVTSSCQVMVPEVTLRALETSYEV